MSTAERESARASPALASGGALELTLLLVVATVLRVIRLDAGLWYDEIVTLVEFARLSTRELLTVYPSTNHHVLYSLLAHLSVSLFGESAWALRLPALLFGIASLAALWWMAHAFVPPRQARLATWAVALSYHHVWFSQNARGYTGIMLFAWLGTGLFAHLLRRPRRATALAYGLSLALAAYTHLSSLLVFAAHATVWLGDALVRRRRPAPYALQGFAVGAGLGALLYAPLLPQIADTLTSQRVAGSGALTVRTWKSPLWTLFEVAGSLPLAPLSSFVLGLGVAVAAYGLWRIARRTPRDAALLALPAAFTLVALLALGFNVWPRYFLVNLGFAALCGVHGVYGIFEGIGGRARRLALPACVAAIALSGATLVANYRLPKQDYSGARDFVRAHAGARDVVLTGGLASYAYGRFYAPQWRALERLDQISPGAPTDLGGHAPALRHGGDPAAPATIWVLYTFPMHLRAVRPDLWDALERDFEVLRRFPGTVGDGAVVVVRRRLPRGARVPHSLPAASHAQTERRRASHELPATAPTADAAPAPAGAARPPRRSPTP